MMPYKIWLAMQKRSIAHITHSHKSYFFEPDKIKEKYLSDHSIAGAAIPVEYGI